MYNRLTWKVGGSFEDGKLRSRYMDGRTSGFTGFASLAVDLQNVIGLYVTGRVAYASLDNDIDRTTNAGDATVDNLSSDGWLTGLGVAHVMPVRGLRIQTGLEAVAYNTKVDGFTERNAASASDALTVNSQSKSGSAFIASLGASGAITEKIDFSVAGKAITHSNEGYNITARLNTEATQFGVRTQGVSDNQLIVSAGLRYKVTEADTLNVGFATSGSRGNSSYFNYHRRF